MKPAHELKLTVLDRTGVRGYSMMLVWDLAILGGWDGRQCQGSSGHMDATGPVSDVIPWEGNVSPLRKAVSLGWARHTDEGGRGL